MAGNNLTENLLIKEDHVSITIPAPTPVTIPVPAPVRRPAPVRDDRDVCGLTLGTIWGLFLLTLGIVFTSVFALCMLMHFSDDQGLPAIAVEKVESLLPAFVYVGGVAAAVSYLAMTVHCILPWFAYCLRILNENLLIKEDHVSITIPAPTPATIPVAEPVRRPAPVRDDRDVCGLTFDRYWGLFLLTLGIVFSSVFALGMLMHFADDQGLPAAAVEKVESLLPAFLYVGGAAVAVSYLAMTVHCILPRFAYCLRILSIILVLAQLAFFVADLLIMDSYIYFYVAGGVMVYCSIYAAIYECRRPRS